MDVPMPRRNRSRPYRARTLAGTDGTIGDGNSHSNDPFRRGVGRGAIVEHWASSGDLPLKAATESGLLWSLAIVALTESAEFGLSRVMTRAKQQQVKEAEQSPRREEHLDRVCPSSERPS